MKGIHITPNRIVTSDCIARIQPPWLDWLLEQVGDEPCMMYHLDANVACLLRMIMITEEEGRKLLATNKLHLNLSSEYQHLVYPYRITYYPGKYFSIAKSFGKYNPYARFYNAGQYINTYFVPYENMEVAEGKAIHAEITGDEVLKSLHRLGLDYSKLTSPIRALDKQLDELNLPTVDDMPNEASELAYGCVKGNWLEAYSSGRWEEAYDYDLNGAYGSELAKLFDLRAGEWIHSKKYQDNAIYGFAYGTLTTHAQFHPFLLRVSDDASYTPVGSWNTYLTMNEIDFLYRYKLGSFEIKDAWWWIPRDEPDQPLKNMIEWLYSQKQQGTDLDQKIARRCLAGIWGRFLEFRGEAAGPMFNPVYGAVVESNIRLKVAGACLNSGVMPLHIAVDGCITDKPLQMSLSDSLGCWRLSHKGKCIIVSSGVVGFEGKGGAEEFSLTYEWLDEQMRDNPDATSLEMKKYSPNTLAKCLNTDSFDRLGEVEEITRAVVLEPDNKRLWKDGKSYPLDTSLILGVNNG